MFAYGWNNLEGKKVSVIFYGIGAIGSEAVKYALAKEWIQIVGAIDIDRTKAGKDLGEVVGLPKDTGIKVSNDALSLLRSIKSDVVVHTSGSFFKSVYSQLEEVARAGMNIITSAEELAFPSLQNPEITRRLDEIAKGNGVTIVAAGINPGFVMDALIVYLATACLDVKSVRARRIVDSSRRRKQLQLKVGAGSSVDEFKAKLGKTIFGHIGLLESAALVADRLKMRPDEISQTIEPVIAQRLIASEHIEVKPGHVAGIKQLARCFKGGEELVNLEMQVYLGALDQRDEILIQGTPRIELTIKDGISGDQATVATLINSIPSVLNAKPGLLTPTGDSASDIDWYCPYKLGY